MVCASFPPTLALYAHQVNHGLQMIIIVSGIEANAVKSSALDRRRVIGTKTHACVYRKELSAALLAVHFLG